ncbi:MAG: hypothetical protein IPI79_10315 [Moraxellaceae bacterium]|nr:hypothetical protein [Moraxellaceae bacterium]
MARLGSDEFALILDQAQSHVPGRVICGKIIDTLLRPF